MIRSTVHNMAEEPDEIYYREEYLYWIRRSLENRLPPSGSIWLDLGCGQGRLTIPLAESLPDQLFRGVDLSRRAIDEANGLALKSNLKNCTFYEADIITYLESDIDLSPSVVLMNEVTFFFPEWRDALRLLEKRMRPGALLFISFRPLYFYALMLIRSGLTETAAQELLRNREGPLFPGSPTMFTWIHYSEAVEALTKEFRFTLIQGVGIGSCSGILGDPHALISQPSNFSEGEKAALRTVERNIGEKVPDTGRYMLFAVERC